jgi:hypothetical protein
MRIRRRGEERARFGGHRSFPRDPSGVVYLRIPEDFRKLSEPIMCFKRLEILSEWDPLD